LTVERRQSVWSNLFKQASIGFDGDMKWLADQRFNGRQIRNFVRLAKIMYPTSPTLSKSDMQTALEFGFGDDEAETAVA
jgi:hypothetical protein